MEATLQNVPETGHGAGAIVTDSDPRNLVYGEHIGNTDIPFDWDEGFDVESEISKSVGSENMALFVNDQNGSGSCGGQASSKFGEVISAIHNKRYDRKSAKFIYAQCFVKPAGSSDTGLFGVATKKGFCDETLLSSYDLNQPPSEAFMERVDDITPDAFSDGLNDRAMAYAVVQNNIDAVAQAIRDKKGVVIGIYGQNNGTWRTAYPLPPANVTDPANQLWSHWVYAGKAKMIDGKKYIGFLNSWGSSTGDKGWQWIAEDYFNAKWGIWRVWTMIYDSTPIAPVGHNLFSQTLRYGMPRNGDVKKLQMILGILDDGIFKNQTLVAVKKFQKENGLLVDGIVGAYTQAKLKEVFHI